MGLLFSLLARLPLPLLHRMGAWFGWIAYLSSRRYAARLRDNLRNAYPDLPEADFRRLLHANVRESGKAVMELPWIWLRPYEEVLASVKACHGAEHIAAAQAQGKGVIALAPHLGGFELISLYAAATHPVTCMYRPPRHAFLEPLIRQGRERGQMRLAPADMSGVRLLLKALKRGEIIGILPDQAPGNGEGEWTPFFGRPAYTMTLLGRLKAASDAPVLICRSERLPDGRGYELHYAPLELDPAQPIPPQVNAALEREIRACPAQYLWSYNRYKVPRGAPPPDAIEEH